jgi:cation/acetate symporter
MSNPTIFTVPLGFIGAYLGTILSKAKDEENRFAEVLFKSNTGYGISSAKDH